MQYTDTNKFRNRQDGNGNPENVNKNPFNWFYSINDFYYNSCPSEPEAKEAEATEQVGKEAATTAGGRVTRKNKKSTNKKTKKNKYK